MGVDCSAKLAFGIQITNGAAEAVLEKLGIDPHDEPCEQVAEKYGLECTELGSCYSETYIVIGPSFDFKSEFGGPNADAKVQADLDGCRGLKELIKTLEDLGEDPDDPDWYLETLWW